LVTQHKLIQICLLVTTLFFVSLSNASNTLTATVDRNPVMVGESFTLSVVANFKTSSNNLDTSKLLRQFVVGGTSVGSNTRIVNGEISRQTTWNISLAHQHAGTYTIPELSMDGTSSKPLTIKVIEQPNTGNTQSANQDVRLIAELAHDSAYVGQQLLYQVKLYIGASLQRAELKPPVLQGAEITPLGEDADSNEILDGRRYRVITRNYSVKPTQAGDFQFKGSVFRGDISLSGRTSYFNNGRSKPVTLISDSKAFTVHAIPANFPGDWLVSAHVVLQDEWSDNKTFTVGEPITRTITLTAADTTAEQLPKLAPDFGPTFNTYPDKRTTQQGLNGTTLIAQAVHKIAVIPSVAGNFVIPAVKLPWFNSVTKQVEWATIAPKSVVVATATKQSQPLAQPTPMAPAVQPSTPTNVPSAQVNIEPPTLGYWQLATLLLSLALILCAGYIYQQRGHVVAATTTQTPKQPKLQRQVEQAIASSNAALVLKLMPMWLNKYHQLDVQQLVNIDSALAEAYQRLAKNHYSQQSEEQSASNFSELSVLFKSFCNTRQPSHDSLLKLYP